MNRIARRSAVVTILVILLLAGFVFFLVEYAVKSSKWIVTPGSPHVYAEENFISGAVTDRDGVLLLNMQGSDWKYSSDADIRKATLHWVGDRDGMIEVPATPNYYEDVVNYDFFNGLYSYGNEAGTGGVLELTVSSKLQATALEALGDHKGTVAVYNYKTGEILCAVTTPTYDPDDIPDIAGNPEQFDGVYMNRFIQSAYTPGSIFKIVTLAAALENIPDIEERTFLCTGKWDDAENTVTCENAHGEQTLKEAFCNSCNCTFASLAREMGGKTLFSYVNKLGVTKPVRFDGITTAAGNFDLDEYYITLGWSAIGQHTDLINPCAYMNFMGCIAGGGRAANPYVVQSATDGKNGYHAQTDYGSFIMDRELAQKLQEYMRYAVQHKYGDENFPGLSVCAKTGTAEKDGDTASNAMFAGFVTDEEYPLAFIICVEEGGYGASTCIPIASQVLAACKEMIDAG